MIENHESWASGMTILGLIAVLVIFGSAWLWVSTLRKGNRWFRFWQRRHPEEASPPPGEEYPKTRDDLR
jgi:hypothetical protein